MPRQPAASSRRPRLPVLALGLLFLCPGATAWRGMPPQRKPPPPPPRAAPPPPAAGPPAVACAGSSPSRRAALQRQLLPALLPLASLLLPPTPATAAAAPPTPPAKPAPTGSVLLLSGFQIPAEQYEVYAERLREAGLARVSVRADGNSLGDSASRATTMGSVGDGGEAAVEGFEAEALGIVGEIVAQEQTSASPILLVGHSRGGALAVRVAHALLQQQQQAARGSSSSSQLKVPKLAGLVLLDPVDYPPTSNAPSQSTPEGEQQLRPQSSSCLPLLAALRRASAPAVPVAIAALPYSGVNRYYKSRNKNLCAPPGRDAAAFYEAATTSNGGGDGVVLMTLPEAGHLQLLQRRADLSFAEMCGVGPRVPEAQVQDLCANLVVACARAWVGGDGIGDVKERVLGKGGDGEGFRSIDPAVAATVEWRVGGL